MQRYEHTDVVFEIPDDWEDRTVTAFASPMRSGQQLAPNIVLTRDLIDNNEPVATYADRQLVELAKRLDDFLLQRRREMSLDGHAAVELLFTWGSGNGRLQQKQVFVIPRKGTVMSFVATALQSQFTELEQTFEEIFASIGFP